MNNKILPVAVTLFATSTALAQQAVQWKVSEGGNGHWYRGIRAPGITWTHARDASREAGGDLLSLSSAQESSWVFQAIVSDSSLWWSHPVDGPRHGPWLGLFQDTAAMDYQEPAGGWKWVDGSRPAFVAWASSTIACESQPSDCRCNPAEGCGMNFGSFYAAAPCLTGCVPVETWGAAFNDMGNYAVSYVTEWSADCNNDGIVDYGQILQGQLADANSDGVPDICEVPTCEDADLYPNGRIDGADLAILLSEWGPVNPTTTSDIDGSGFVNGSDLAKLLGFWGFCVN